MPSRRQIERQQARRDRFAKLDRVDVPDPDESVEFTPVELPEVSVPEGVSTAKGLLAWVDSAPDDAEHLARAEAARVVNDGRAKPWVSVTTAVDGILN